MQGEITVTLSNGKVLGFKFCNRSEFLEGAARQAFGYDPLQPIAIELANGFRLYAAAQAYKGNTGLFADLDEFLDLLDLVADDDREKIMEVAEQGLGFTMRWVRQQTAKVQASPASRLAGKSDGKHARPLPLAD